jgi:hypothetical protein
MPAVLYGCESRSLAQREEHRLKVFQNRVLRIFGLRYEVTRVKTAKQGALRPVPLTKYDSGDQIKNKETGVACCTYGRQEMSIQGFGRET